jgi:hypothetical protein
MKLTDHPDYRNGKSIIDILKHCPTITDIDLVFAVLKQTEENDVFKFLIHNKTVKL